MMFDLFTASWGHMLWHLVEIIVFLIVIYVMKYVYDRKQERKRQCRQVPDFLNQICPYLPFTIPYFQRVNEFTFTTKVSKQFRDKGFKIGNIAIGRFRRTMVMDADMAYKICQDRKSFRKPHEEYQMAMGELGMNKNILLSSGENWKRMRLIADQAFLVRHLKIVVSQSVLSTDLWIEKVSGKIEKGELVDAKEGMCTVGLDIITKIAFGTDIGVFGPSTISREYEYSLIDIAKFILGDALKYNAVVPKSVTKIFSFLLPFSWNPCYRMTRSYELLRIYMNDILEEKKKNPGDDLLTQLLNSSNDGKKLTEEEVRSNAFIFLLAGFETSATAMAWTLYEISKHPDIQKKVQTEVDKLRGKDLCIDSLEKDLPYLRRVIFESLRLHPPVFSVPKMATRKKTINGVTFPKGCIVRLDFAILHSDKKYWGEDVSEFNPDRWEKPIVPGSFMPFSLGSRKCIGYDFSLIEQTCILTRLCQEFEFSLPSKYKDSIDVVAGITRAPRELDLRMRKRYS